MCPINVCPLVPSCSPLFIIPVPFLSSFSPASPLFARSLQHKRHVQATTKYVELIIVADNREVSRGHAVSHLYPRMLISMVFQGFSKTCSLTSAPSRPRYDFPSTNLCTHVLICKWDYKSQSTKKEHGTQRSTLQAVDSQKLWKKKLSVGVGGYLSLARAPLMIATKTRQN